MADNDYKVGKGRPPKHTRFQKGASGNPAGRRPKKAIHEIDVSAILETPIQVKQGGQVKTMHPFEVMVRRLVREALRDKKPIAILEFLYLCKKYKLLNSRSAPPTINPVQYIPSDWNAEEWLEMLRRYGAPPWPGPRNGLCKREF